MLSLTPGDWKKVWSSIPPYPCFLKKDLISNQTPTSKESGCFFWKLPVYRAGAVALPVLGPACTPRELLVREDGEHPRRSLQGILPLRDFRLATAVLCSPRGFSGVCRDLPLPFHTGYSSGFSTLLKMIHNMGDSLHAHLEPFSGSAQ